MGTNKCNIIRVTNSFLLLCSFYVYVTSPEYLSTAGQKCNNSLKQQEKKNTEEIRLHKIQRKFREDLHRGAGVCSPSALVQRIHCGQIPQFNKFHHS